MLKQSAGILLFKKTVTGLKVFLVHPGGPFWKNKDLGAWSIPKGEFEEGEDPLKTARRELEEETGHKAEGKFIPLQTIKQKGGKWVWAWAIEGDIDATTIKSNSFTIEWPPRSGKQVEFPEVDKASWFSINDARSKINPAQSSFLEELQHILENE